MKYFFVFCSLFLLNSSYAEVCKKVTKIYYGNGMFNTKEDALASLEALEGLDYSEIRKSGSSIEFDCALNLEESQLMNVLNVVLQSVENDYREAWRNLLLVKKPTPQILLIMESESLRQKNEAMRRNYERDLKSNKRVILISHSQGNFYADTVMQNMFDGMSPTNFGFANIQVATPSDNFFEFPYVTFEDDWIIKIARKFSVAPPANLPEIGARPFPGDPLGHNFVKAYLETPESRDMIQNHILRLAKKLPYPEDQVAFKVKVVKANDDYSFFKYKIGPNGVFDAFRTKDSRDMVEEKEVLCSELVEGRFEIDEYVVFSDLSQVYKYTVEVTIGREVQNFAAETGEKIIDGSYYAVTLGKWPIINMKPVGNHFDLSLDSIQYPPKKLN
jgi:hypothetical protein